MTEHGSPSQVRPPRRNWWQKRSRIQRTATVAIVAAVLVAGAVAVLLWRTSPAPIHSAVITVPLPPQFNKEIAKGIDEALKPRDQRIDTMDKRVGKIEGDVKVLQDKPAPQIRIDPNGISGEEIAKEVEALGKKRTPPVPPAKPANSENQSVLPSAPRTSVPAPAQLQKLPGLREATAPSSEPARQISCHSAELFRFNLFVVEDGLSLGQVVDRSAKTDGKRYDKQIAAVYHAAMEGKVKWFAGDGTATFRFLNIDATKVPDEIPYLEGIEHGCAENKAVVKRIDGRTVEFTVPVSGQNWGQVFPLLPVEAFAGLAAPTWCIVANFPLSYAPNLTQGSFKGAKDTVCDLPAEEPSSIHKTGLAARISAGKMSESTGLIHGKETELP